MKNSIAAIFLSVLFVAPAYTQTMSLQSISKGEYALDFGYSQKSSNDWFREDVTDHTFRVNLSRGIFSRINFSLLPCFILRRDTPGLSESSKVPGCFFRVTKTGRLPWIKKIDIDYFLRLGLGALYELYPEHNFLTGELQVSASCFHTWKIGKVGIKPFGTINLGGVSRNIVVGEAVANADGGPITQRTVLELLGEIGIETTFPPNVFFQADWGIFATWNFSTIDLASGFHVGMRVLKF